MEIKITNTELKHLLNVLYDVEAMIGGADSEDNFNWDDETKKRLKSLRKMLDKNKIPHQINN